MNSLYRTSFVAGLVGALCLYASAGIATSSESLSYFNKFMMYRQWQQQLPLIPDDAFFTFIKEDSPLSQKIREKWLYQLAHNNDWANYIQYYQPSNDMNLQCYQQRALYQQGQADIARKTAEQLWLTGNSLPSACHDLFSLLFKNKDISENLIQQRIVLAFEKNNIPLLTYLFKQYQPPRTNQITWLLHIEQHPKDISHLPRGEWQSELYLYGLKRLINTHTKTAVELWARAKQHHLFTEKQQQTFLVELSLYKAMRHDPDEAEWFSQVKPDYYTEALLSWQIRTALKYQQWATVKTLIHYSKNYDDPCWQYWLARALEAQHHQEEAQAIYQTLSNTRNYYGFLASRRLKKEFYFADEPIIKNQHTLRPYAPITQQIKTLYLSKQMPEASRLLNDFVSELPKNDQSALAYWIDNELEWHGKSVSLSNNKALNNQLSLRFPLAYESTIKNHAKQYHIPEELIYAIIRQESAFRDDALSSAGAQGLMQIMPATAKVISKSAKIPYTSKKQLFSSQKNINIGTAYLSTLAKRFGQHPILMVAAYNAGPKQVVYWLKNHPPKEMDLWIETLPWVETRNYLKNVIAFYAVYQHRLQEKPNLSAFMQEFNTKK